ncbi:MAG: quinol monooxygenase YgiN [Verrucomicrobiales bacterium]|jgi:quinol monooxygenase YgiN
MNTKCTKWIQFTVSETNASTFHSALKRVEEASRVESGCVHYAAFVNKDNTSEFTVLEIWDCDDSLEAHRQSSHLAEFKSACGNMILEKTALDLLPL